jgi:hypothetical protein
MIHMSPDGVGGGGTDGGAIGGDGPIGGEGGVGHVPQVCWHPSSWPYMVE